MITRTLTGLMRRSGYFWSSLKIRTMKSGPRIGPIKFVSYYPDHGPDSSGPTVRAPMTSQSFIFFLQFGIRGKQNNDLSNSIWRKEPPFHFGTTNQQNLYAIITVPHREKRDQTSSARQKHSSMVHFQVCPPDWMNLQPVGLPLLDRLLQRVLLVRLRLRAAPNCLLLRRIQPVQVKV